MEKAPASKQTGLPQKPPPHTSPAAALQATDAPHVVPSVEQVCTPLPSGAQRVMPGAHIPLQVGCGTKFGPHGLPVCGLHVVGEAHWVAVHSYPLGVIVQVL